MASETATPSAAETDNTLTTYGAGVIGGLVGGLAFGLLMWMMMRPVMAVAIPSLYGLAPPANPVAGWLLHLGHSVVFGLVFAGIVNAANLRDRTTGVLAAAGLGYGIVIWLIFAVFVMPIWLSAVGSPADPPLPNIGMESLVGHAVFGVLLGVVYAVLARR